MKRLFSFVMALVLIMTLTSVGGVSFAAGSTNNLYVSTKGSDTNDGSLAHPFATIDKAARVATPGTIVHVAPGTYGRVRSLTSGTADARIVFISDVKWGAKIVGVNAWDIWRNEADYVDIIGFDISGNGFNGILNTASYVRMIGNHVHNVGNVDDMAANGGNGGAGICNVNIYATPGHDNEVLGNVIHDIGPYFYAPLIHGIYQANGTAIIQNNMVYNTSGFGIHLWHYAANVIIDKNLVYGNLQGGIIVGRGDSPHITNNCVTSNNIVMYNLGGGGDPAVREGSANTGTNNTYINNILYGNQYNSMYIITGQSPVGTKYEDPQFVNFQPDGSGDYYLLPTSPAVPQDAYYDADENYGYYPAWYSRTDWNSAIYDLGSGNVGEISAQFDLTVSDAASNGFIGYAGSSTSVGSEADIPMLIVLNSTKGYFEVRNGGNFESLAQVSYAAGSQYHFKVIPDFTAKTYDVFVTPEGGTEILIADNYAFQGTAEMDGLARLALKSDNDSAFKVENHTMETTNTSSQTGNDEQYVITGEDWVSEAALADGIHKLGDNNTGIVTMTFDFIPIDKTQDLTIGYADSSTTVDGWSKMSMIISNEAGLDDVYFTARNGGNYEHVNLVPIINGKLYHFRIIADLTAKTYSVYVTPKDGAESAIALNYAFRSNAPEMDDIGQLCFSSAFDGGFAMNNHNIIQWISKAAFGSSMHNLGESNTGTVTMTFDFIPVDKTQDLTIGYADSSTVVDGWSKMSMIISNEIGLDDVYFTARNGGGYEHVNLVPIINGKLYHFRIVSDLAAKTYSVYVTPKGGTETVLGQDYLFRSSAPLMDDIGQLSFGSAFDGGFYMINHTAFQWASKQVFADSMHDLGEGNTGTVTITFGFMPLDKTQDLTIGYADSSTTVDGWSKMPIIISNEAGLDDVYFTARNGGSYTHANLIPIKDGQIYYFRIVADLAAKTYSVYITPKGGTETVLGENYAFRSNAPLMDDVGQLCFESAYSDTFYISNHNIAGDINKTALINTIAAAQLKVNNAVVGVVPLKPGEVLQSDLDALIAAISAAQSAADNVSATASEVSNALIALNTAISLYDNAVAKLIVYVAGDGSGDYNCDGTDDNIEINQALEFVASNPAYSTVYLKGPFTYNVNNTMYISSNTILEGDKTAVVKLAQQDPGSPVPSFMRSMFSAKGDSAHDITIRGFEIDGNELNNWSASGYQHYNMIQLLGSSNITINGIYFHNGLGDAIKIQYGTSDEYIRPNTNIDIYNNIIDRVGNNGIYLMSVSDISIHDNIITNMNDVGIRLFNSNNVKIYNNTISSENRGGSGIEIAKKYGAVVNDIEIYKNTISNIQTMGIWLYGYGSYNYPLSSASGVRIHHNIISDCGSYTNTIGGIIVTGFDNTVIENNVLDGNYKDAIASAVYLNYSAATPLGTGYTTIVRNNIITNTKADANNPDTGYGINNRLASHIFILENNCVYNNFKGDYNNVDHPSDINVDPLFADAANHDYHLKSEYGRWDGTSWINDDVTSPCIDAGNPLSDYSIEPEENGERINIGAYGNTVEASKTDPYYYDVTAPVITVTGNKEEYLLNEDATTDWSADDGADGSGVAGQVSGTITLDTSAVGEYSVAITSTDLAGNVATKEITYIVKYAYSNLLKPVDLNGSNGFKQGSTIPLKLRLSDADVNFIANATVKLFIAEIIDGVAGTESEAVSSTQESAGNTFRYDSTDEQYIFNFGTKLLSPGVYQLRVDLGDTTVNTVIITIN
ncbi:MAG: right-handed parallel beta-helix repeat-containing protein [Clostridiaceae bacterium]